ncbi:sensor TorS domain protein, partial [Vibrio parahaemolyticus AQ3810]
HQHDCGC